MRTIMTGDCSMLTYAAQELIDFSRTRCVRNRALSVTVGERTPVPTTKWEGKTNSFWLGFCRRNVDECGFGDITKTAVAGPGVRLDKP